MIFGMDIYTFMHVALSLIGIATGIIVLFGWLADTRLPGWTALFLTTTVLTSATGFGFPFNKLLPSHIVGIISLIVLAIRFTGSMAPTSRVRGSGFTSQRQRSRSISTSSSWSFRLS
jgi:hypothetical protein